VEKKGSCRKWIKWREWDRWRRWQGENCKRTWRNQERFLVEMEELAEMKKKRACLIIGIS